MNQALLDRVVNAVLYEGYVLYPYRPSVKNRQRWTFGGLYPAGHCAAADNGDAARMQTECLVRGGANTQLEVQVRFLHLQARTVGRFKEPVKDFRADNWPAFQAVDQLQVNGQVYHTWQEALERSVGPLRVALGQLTSVGKEFSFAFPGARTVEPLPAAEGVAGILLRESAPVAGSVCVRVEAVADDAFRVRVEIANETPWENQPTSREAALLRALVSTHTMLGVQGGEFVSLLDPPDAWRAAAEGCRNVGAYPVLVGEAGAKDTMLSSPIILYDYPQIAPESPGDLFDALEIDEILTLRILTLTEEEKQAMAAVDSRTQGLLQRTEELARAQLQGLHGTIRGLRTEEGTP